MDENVEESKPKLWPWFIGIIVLMVIVFFIGLLIMYYKYSILKKPPSTT